MLLPKKVLVALLPFFIQAKAQSGSGQTTRYWDCCKASCAWSGKTTLASGATPVVSCDKNDKPLSDSNAKSACDTTVSNGPAFMCSSQSPWAVSSTLAYGFAAATIAGGTESSWCCECYELTFTSTAIAGKQMIVQVTNTGGDLGTNQFDLAIPGGGFGIFNGCSTEWGGSTQWGAQYGGVSSRSMCSTFPNTLQPGCDFRWDWFEGADNPTMTFQKVTCPAALTAKSGCIRSGETPSGPSSVSTWTSRASAPTSVAGSSVSSSSPSTTSAEAGSSSSDGTVPQYGQCGGIGWTGSTVCASGYTCTAIGSYYSQCL